MSARAERLVWGDRPPPRKERQRVARALAEGALVALPTETVYGLAARADRPEPVARLRALKKSDPARPLTWHVGDAAALERFERVSPMARRLAAKYWPGPLTLVLPGVPSGLEAAARAGWTGVRFPAHLATAKLLERLDFPVVATSVNAEGEAPLNHPAAIEDAWGNELAFVIDGGKPRLGESSVVLQVGPGRFELLRSGILELEQLRAVAGLSIGFVCTGNTCRSPLAEGIARSLAAERLQVAPQALPEFGFEFRSMGLLAGGQEGASPHTLEVLARRGIDLSQHRTSCAVPEEIARLDRVYAMTPRHLEGLRLMLPPGKDAHCALLDPLGEDILDPIGGALEDYERTAQQIERAVRRRLDEWI